MTRKKIQPDVPVLALRRAEAAAALGVSVETFDQHVRPRLGCVYLGGVRIYPVSTLQAFLDAHAIDTRDGGPYRGDQHG